MNQALNSISGTGKPQKQMTQAQIDSNMAMALIDAYYVLDCLRNGDQVKDQTSLLAFMANAIVLMDLGYSSTYGRMRAALSTQFGEQKASNLDIYRNALRKSWDAVVNKEVAL